MKSPSLTLCSPSSVFALSCHHRDAKTTPDEQASISHTGICAVRVPMSLKCCTRFDYHRLLSVFHILFRVRPSPARAFTQRAVIALDSLSHIVRARMNPIKQHGCRRAGREFKLFFGRFIHK